MKKVAEEFAEVKGALRSKNKKHIEEEIGDLMFTLVALSYFLRIDPENAVQKTNDKFIRRFKRVEKHMYPGMREREMLSLWRKTKI
jgi:tetrapyrrole methylase family protein/MazG family protein